MKGRLAIAGFLVVLIAPSLASAAVIREQPVFNEVENVSGDVPLIFSGASQRTPSLISLFSATGTVRTAKIRYDMSSWTNPLGAYVYLYECPLQASDTLKECHRVVARDPLLGWDGQMIHPPATNSGELSVDFTSAVTTDFTPAEYFDGVPLVPNRGYRLEAIFEPNAFNVNVHGKTGEVGGFTPYFKLEGDVATSAPSKPDPVIIIPGILGSQEKNGEWVIDPILHGYDDLIATLDANDYTSGVDLFTFPYDWRKSNVETAVLLKQKIDAVKQSCGCAKVDLVAHSMGGLVARQYIQSGAYQNDVDQLIFLGTPHLGAPKAFLMWDGGEIGPAIDITSTVMEKLLKQEAKEYGYKDLFDYVQNAPILSVKELLPIYDSIFENSQVRTYPINYSANTFLENLKIGWNNIDQSQIQVTNITGVTGSSTTLVAINASTTTQYLPKWRNGVPVGFYNIFGDHGFIYGEGDGTVPFSSAASVDSHSRISPACHLALPAFEAEHIFKILTGGDVNTPGNVTDLCKTRVLILKILSPADIVVVAPSGKRVGKDFVTDSEINEIEGSYYSGFTTENEFITILNPEHGLYKVFTKGTANGSYVLEAEVLDNGGVISASFTGNTLPNLVTEYAALVTSDLSGFSISPADQTPPMITFSRPSTTTPLHSESLPISIQIGDPSGVGTSSVYFDGMQISASTTVDLFLKSLGSHTISVSAVDLVGNGTTSRFMLQVGSTLEDTKKDLARIYKEGQIKKDLKDLLASQLNQAVILQKVTSFSKNGTKTTAVLQVLDRVLLTLMLKEIQIGKQTKNVTPQGYDILSNDLNWLLSH